MLSQGDGLGNLIQQVSFISYFYDFVIKSAPGTLTESKSDLVICLATRAHITVCRAQDGAYSKENVPVSILSGQFLSAFQPSSPRGFLTAIMLVTAGMPAEGGNTQYALLFEFIDLAENNRAVSQLEAQ